MTTNQHIKGRTMRHCEPIKPHDWEGRPIPARQSRKEREEDERREQWFYRGSSKEFWGAKSERA